MNQYPGTDLSVSGGESGEGFTPFDMVLRITGGVTLGQLCELTSLEPSTIQNWVKRGWVPRPDGKRYGEKHIARILLINALRGALPLEKIIELLHYVNGNLNDTVDDILSDRPLYDLLCRAVSVCGQGTPTEQSVALFLKDFVEPYPGAKETLRRTLAVMLPAYRASICKREAEAALNQLNGGNEHA